MLPAILYVLPCRLFIIGRIDKESLLVCLLRQSSAHVGRGYNEYNKEKPKVIYFPEGTAHHCIQAGIRFEVLKGVLRTLTANCPVKLIISRSAFPYIRRVRVLCIYAAVYNGLSSSSALLGASRSTFSCLCLSIKRPESHQRNRSELVTLLRPAVFSPMKYERNPPPPSQIDAAAVAKDAEEL